MTVTELAPARGRASWRDLPAEQQPQWPDPVELDRVVGELSAYPPLVFAGECDRLRERLARVALGQAFVLQGGDCAETFAGVSAEGVFGKLRTLQQMSLVLGYASSLPVVPIGRLAGQFAKPRSRPTETRDGLTLPAYRGDSANGLEFTRAARTPDPERLKRAYHAAAVTLNLVRAFTAGPESDPRRAHEATRAFVAGAPEGERYAALLRELDAALDFAQNIDPGAAGPATEVFTSHEALFLDYESALTRVDPATGRGYDASAHMVWIGERTRRLDGAHVEFAAAVANPVGVKLGPSSTADEALALVDRLDPDRVPGRLTFISRMGADRVRDLLPTLVDKVTASGATVVWLCDPMHGNTFTAPSGHKTRRVTDVLDEVTGFFEVHRSLGTHPGGLHVELTGEEVTECLGGSVDADDLPERYESACDPRLNRSQSLDLAFRVAGLFPARGNGSGG